MQAIEAFIAEQGGPEVIQWREVTLGAPAAGQVLVRQTAIGLNYIDTYHRDGTYPIELPGGLGVEAAGEVVATGPDVHGLQPGDRVATFGPQQGAYASARILPAASLMKLPAGIDDDTAAAALLKACTVEALVERCAKIEAGWPVLVHAAAGGVGLILVQWLKAVGATVIGTVSTEAKAQTARDAGADHVIRYKQDDVAAHVREITDGQGVPVTFDGIGDKRTRTLKGTRSAGTMEVVCGIDPADAGQLAVIAAEKTIHDYAFKLVLNDAPPAGTPSERYFIAKVMSQSEQFDQANNVMKLNFSLGVNSNIVRVAAAED